MAKTLHRPLLLALVVLVLALHVALTVSETLTPDGLLSKLDKRDRVTLTTADGQKKEITVAEMERLAQEQHRKQAEMQREATVKVTTATAASSGVGNTVEYKEDEETAPKRKTESLEQVRKSDPRFAANIELARRSFAEIQRHGYARGYVLAGFSEKDEAAAAAHTQTKARTIKTTKGARADYDASLLLRAKRDPRDAAARTGTSAQKRASEPLAVAYEVHVRMDAQDQFAVLAAWELDASDARSTRLSIVAADVKQPRAAPSSSSQQQQQETSPTMQWALPRAGSPTWFLVGGIALIGAGVVVLYTSQQPAPIARRVRGNSADKWELVTDKKTSKKSGKKAVTVAKKTD